MKPPPFSYHAPDTIEDAVSLLGSLENAKLLAGGQSLMPMLNMRYAQPDHLIDLNRVAALAFIREEAGGIEIGAMTRQREVEYSKDVARLCPLLAEALPQVGHRQTRNRGTVGGSLAHSDGAAEIPTVAAALDARLTITGPGGAREVAYRDFPVGYLMTALGWDELLVAVHLAAWAPGHGWAFQEFARRHGDFAIVSAAALIERDAAGIVTRAALALGGMGAAPVRAEAAEAALIGRPGSEETIRAAADTCRSIEAQDDVHAPAAYRQKLAGVLACRALARAAQRAQASRVR
ncbi:MAG: xanthine dehydrogenase family protein subunit M [Alphaproteobacteria bacterium]|nr:xanthine dehydrogenase family protein subunit M [Alphaproteobacteria bacterium]